MARPTCAGAPGISLAATKRNDHREEDIMKVLQLGVGAIGTVVARHLAGHRAVESLTLGDMDTRRAETLAKELKGNVSVKRIDAADNTSLQAALSGHGLVVRDRKSTRLNSSHL